jgi:hypothetical protein
MNKYYFEGMRWIGSYGDFDYDCFEVEAMNENDALKELLEKSSNWSSVFLTKVNGVLVKK